MFVLARLSRGVGQAELAESINVSAGLLSKIESGATAPSDAVTEKVAQALRYPTRLLYRPEHVRGTDSICLHHRKRKSMPVRLLSAIEAQMFLAAIHVRTLLNDLEIDVPYHFPTIDPDDYDSDPRTVAEVVRGLWNVPRGPIPNLVKLIEAAGGVVLMRDFGTPKLDGMSCWPKGCPPLFFLNSALPTDRLRFTLAHEAGHLIMHASPPMTDPEEEAHTFALELLAPRSQLASDLRRLRFDQLPALKQHWRLSMNALVMAARSTGSLPPSRVNSLFVQLSRSGYRTNEPFTLSPEDPSLLQTAIDVHLREHSYSVEELAEITGLYPDEFKLLYTPEVVEKRRLRVL